MQSAEELQEALDKCNAPFEDSHPEAEKPCTTNSKDRTGSYARIDTSTRGIKQAWDLTPQKAFMLFGSGVIEGSDAWKYIQLDCRRRNELALNPALSLPDASGATAADAKFQGTFTDLIISKDGRREWNSTHVSGTIKKRPNYAVRSSRTLRSTRRAI